MVDARLTPLAAMGLDRGTLMHSLHNGVVYSGIRALPGEKSRGTPSLPLAYTRDGLPELIYKPDGSLDTRKAANGYLGPPNLHKPLLVPGAGTESLGLERRVGPGEKASDLALASASGAYLRLPWLSPYPEASMYPFMDTSKYAALTMYKPSLPSPYLPQHLAYSSLCAAQGGSVNPAATASAAERLYYMSPYTPSPISSPLVAPAMRIPAVTVAPSTLVHCQDKGLPPPFAQQLHQSAAHSQHHQAALERERSPSRSSRPSRPPSRKGSSTNGNTSSTSTNGTSGGNNTSLPADLARLSQPPPPSSLMESSPDLQRPVARMGQPPASSTSSISASSSSIQSIPHPFSVSSMASEQASPARPSPHKPRPREGVPEHRSVGAERRATRSPSKPSFERGPHPPQATREPTEKPLDLSSRLLELGPNGFQVKMDTIVPVTRYGAPPSREQNLSLSPSSHPHSVVCSTSSKVPERPEMISTLHSSWVVPSQVVPTSSRPNTDGLSQAKGSPPSVIKHKSMERVLPQQRSSSCPRIGEPILNVTSSQPSSLGSSKALSPKPSGDWVRHSPGQPEHTSIVSHHREAAEKSSQATKRPDTSQDGPSYKRPCLENGHPPGHLYLPQSDAYLNHSLTYTNRYLHYPIPDGIALHSMSMGGKGPVYPHPVLLGSNSLYPTHLAAKHPIPYHNLPAGPGAEYLSYNSQEMAHPLMQSHSDSKLPERGDVSVKPRGQEKSQVVAEECGGQRDQTTGKEIGEGSQVKLDKQAGVFGQGGSQSKSSSSGTSQEKIVCIDLVHSDTDVESTPAIIKQGSTEANTRLNQKECCHSNQNPSDYEPNHQQHYLSPNSKTSLSDRQPETLQEKPKALQLSSSNAGTNGVNVTSPPISPGPAVRVDDETSEESNASSDEGDEDQSTLRCARTSGERSSGKDKGDRDGRRSPTAQQFTDVVAACDKESEKEDAIVDLGESQGEGDEEEEEGGHASSRSSRTSSLAKRIANSSGYVGDRFKCVTTELYADSSKLSREQRALQMEVISREGSNISQPATNWERAMMRFSELELKEKEGGGGVCVSAPAAAAAAAAAAAGRELADSQQRERALEHGQYATRQGEAEGIQPLYTNNRVPVLQRCPKEPPSPSRFKEAPRRGLDRECEGAAAAPGGGHCLTPRGVPGEKERPGGRKRPPTSASEQEEEEDEDRDRASHAEKRARIAADEACSDEDDEVRKLKVCIELKGLRLSKPATGGAASPDRGWPQGPRERQIRPGEAEERAAAAAAAAAALQRADINRKWGCDKLLNGVVVAASPLTPSQLKDRPLPLPLPPSLGLFSRREPLAAAPPPLKPRRHGDADKPKGKRPCKTKHTGQKERGERRRGEAPATGAAAGSPDPRRHRLAELGAGEGDEEEEEEEDEPSAPRSAAAAASPNHYPGSPVEPRSPATATALCPPSLPPQANGRAAGVPLLLLPPQHQHQHQQQPAAPPAAEPPAVRPIPPEARRLIVNKNAGETLLQRAARLGYEEVVLYCLENRVCEVNHRDYAGYCALHEACARGWLTIVQHLLDYGADINCSAQDGTRPIHDAVENDHLDVVRILLSYGADPTLATYSGRSLLKMTHSDTMESFLTDYFADLQGRSDDDPGLYWEFYGSAVCESSEEGGVYDILADPPGPEDEDEVDKKGVFEFEFSDRPLLPCYNIQVSLSQGPRNWLLLSDVLRRLRMSARGFRQTFPHMEVVTVAEAEFYRQASLSQLFSCPEELEGFQPDSKDLLDLVEDSAELAALLGSTLECLDERWDRSADRLKDKLKAVGKLASS